MTYTNCDWSDLNLLSFFADDDKPAMQCAHALHTISQVSMATKKQDIKRTVHDLRG